MSLTRQFNLSARTSPSHVTLWVREECNACTPPTCMYMYEQDGPVVIHVASNFTCQSCPYLYVKETSKIAWYVRVPYFMSLPSVHMSKIAVKILQPIENCQRSSDDA